jgi:hypothetical protein
MRNQGSRVPDFSGRLRSTIGGYPGFSLSLNYKLTFIKLIHDNITSTGSLSSEPGDYSTYGHGAKEVASARFRAEDGVSNTLHHRPVHSGLTLRLSDPDDLLLGSRVDNRQPKRGQSNRLRTEEGGSNLGKITPGDF